MTTNVTQYKVRQKTQQTWRPMLHGMYCTKWDRRLLTDMMTNTTRHVLYKVREKAFDRYEYQHDTAWTIQSKTEDSTNMMMTTATMALTIWSETEDSTDMMTNWKWFYSTISSTRFFFYSQWICPLCCLTGLVIHSLSADPKCAAAGGESVQLCWDPGCGWGAAVWKGNFSGETSSLVYLVCKCEVIKGVPLT